MKDAADTVILTNLQLGEIEEVYTLKRQLLVVTIFIGVLALTLGILSIFVFAPQMRLHSGLYPLLLIPFMPLFVMSTLWLYQLSNMRVYICTHGLLYLQHKKRQSIRWDEVSQACRYVGGGRGDRDTIYLMSQDGRRVSFVPPDQASRLVKTLQAKGVQYHFRVVKKYNGKTVDYASTAGPS